MIEIDHLMKACGLSAFRYRTFPTPRFDNIPASQISGEVEPEPAPSSNAAQSAPAAPPARAEPRVEPVRPLPPSVLGEVAAVLTPAPASVRSTRPVRAVRSAWRAATSPPHAR